MITFNVLNFVMPSLPNYHPTSQNSMEKMGNILTIMLWLSIYHFILTLLWMTPSILYFYREHLQVPQRNGILRCHVNSFFDFNYLSMAFLTHFQFPIQYETDTDILNSLLKSSSTHIPNHIHEWRWQRRLIKAPIPDQLLMDCFTKSLLPPISHDVSMWNVVTEEQTISQVQYLDLVYSHSGTLYDMNPNAPHPLKYPTKPTLEPSFV